MTQEVFLDAITRLEGEWLDNTLYERSRLLARTQRRIKPLTVKRMGAMAACLAFVMLAGIYVNTVFKNHSEPAPHTEYFASVEAVEATLGADLLLDNLEGGSLSRSGDILVSFPTNGDGTHGSAPLMLQARYTATEAAVDLSTANVVSHVDLYILYDKQNVDDCYIAGYEEQGLTKQYGEISVVYSLIQDPMMHGQAKFLYDGDLYVLDVNSTGNTHFLMKYLDLLLGGEVSP